MRRDTGEKVLPTFEPSNQLTEPPVLRIGL
jgi:hypothetical protein